MKKYRPALTADQVKELERLSNLDFSSFSEADVREEFLVELLKILGYRKELDYSVSREESFRLNPLFLFVGSSRIKLDYLCSLRKKYFWIIDAKKGRCPDKNSPPAIEKDSVAQAYFYSLHQEVNCKYFIVSNGWFTNLYERDTLDDECTPRLSIKSTELPTKFLELDKYVGSTQILPGIKMSILDQIDKVFSAEIRVERLDEFAEEVRKRASQHRPSVQRASIETMASSTGMGGGLMQAIETDDLSSMVYTIFQNAYSLIQIQGISRKVIERLQKNREDHQFQEYMFYSRLVMDVPYPIPFWYYPNVLYFLFEALESLPSPLFFGQKTIQDLLTDWLDLVLFGLSARPMLRFMWLMERLYVKITKRTFLTLPILREQVTAVLEKKLYYIPEEMLPLVRPSEASVLIEMVEKAVTFFRSEFVRKYYDLTNRTFRQTLALEEYSQLVEMDKTFEKTVGEKYQAIKKELGKEWHEFILFEDLEFDMLGSAVISILDWHYDKLNLLNTAQRERLALMAALNCANRAKDLCTKLEMPIPQIDEEARKRLLQSYFDPNVDQHRMMI